MDSLKVVLLLLGSVVVCSASLCPNQGKCRFDSNDNLIENKVCYQYDLTKMSKIRVGMCYCFHADLSDCRKCCQKDKDCIGFSRNKDGICDIHSGYNFMTSLDETHSEFCTNCDLQMNYMLHAKKESLMELQTLPGYENRHMSLVECVISCEKDKKCIGHFWRAFGEGIKGIGICKHMLPKAGNLVIPLPKNSTEYCKNIENKQLSKQDIIGDEFEPFRDWKYEWTWHYEHSYAGKCCCNSPRCPPVPPPNLPTHRPEDCEKGCICEKDNLLTHTCELDEEGLPSIHIRVDNSDPNFMISRGDVGIGPHAPPVCEHRLQTIGQNVLTAKVKYNQCGTVHKKADETSNWIIYYNEVDLYVYDEAKKRIVDACQWNLTCKFQRNGTDWTHYVLLWKSIEKTAEREINMRLDAFPNGTFCPQPAFKDDCSRRIDKPGCSGPTSSNRPNSCAACKPCFVNEQACANAEYPPLEVCLNERIFFQAHICKAKYPGYQLFFKKCSVTPCRKETVKDPESHVLIEDGKFTAGGLECGGQWHADADPTTARFSFRAFESLFKVPDRKKCCLRVTCEIVACCGLRKQGIAFNDNYQVCKDAFASNQPRNRRRRAAEDFPTMQSIVSTDITYYPQKRENVPGLLWTKKA